MDCYAVVPPGLEPLAAEELARLGIDPGPVEPGGVSFRADRGGLCAANLHLHTASRVLVRIATFHASSFHELERRAKRVPWEKFVAPGAAVEFRVTSRKSKLYHQRAVAARLVDAVARMVPGAVHAALADDAGNAAGESADHAAQLFVVRLAHDECMVSADSSGAHLHRRGYRLASGKAPLRETLAAAMLLSTGWNGRAPLIDPMCGSGTIPIEAALIARRMAPGLGRSFAFERWPDFDADKWARLVDAARESILPRAPAPIVGSDRDAGAVAAATANAERAGVAEDVAFRRAAISALDAPAEAGGGWVVTNPPYGVRIGDRAELRNLYAQFGNVLRRRAGGWRVAMLSSSRELEGAVGLRFERRWETSNGGVRVRLVTATVPTPDTPASGHVSTRALSSP
ncbi:MAG TPA: class I SAM-dependent RNA methyltransferase [Gemmatimonadales bacterium]|nr:class I SAM-dependent RNA methyltransferase [Gemmatimonadales bacterium]